MTKLEESDWQYAKVSGQENADEDKNETDGVLDHYGYGVRHIQALLFFSCLCIIYIARAHLGVTIVAMIDVQDSTTGQINETSYDNSSKSLNGINSIENNNTSNIILSTASINESSFNDSNKIIFNGTNDNFNALKNTETDRIYTDVTNATKNYLTENTNDFTKNDAASFIDKNVVSSLTNIKSSSFNQTTEDYYLSVSNLTVDDDFVKRGFNNETEKKVDDNIDPIKRNKRNNYDYSDNAADIKNITSNNINTKNLSRGILYTAKKKNWNIFRTYNWPKSTQEVVLGGFFLGYMIMMSPMGYVCQRWGGKLPLQIGLFSSAIITFFTPWLAAWGNYRAVALSRVMMGLFQSGTYPSLITLIANWVPIGERARFSNYVYSGSMIGTIIAFQLGGFLGASPLGWPSMFWTTGILCMVSFILLTIFGSTTPAEHKYISNKERNFILGQVFSGVEKKEKTPWKAILSSVPVWATFITHIGTSTSFLFVFTQMPSYLHFIFGIDVKNSGFISSLPYVANFLSSIAIGILSDYCTNNNILTIRQTRIISNSIASVGPALCLAAVSFTKSTVLAVICLVITMSSLAGTHTGWMINYIDLSPNYSGTLMATGNTLMNIAALMIPTLVSNVVVDVRNPYQWRIVMFIVGAFGFVGNAIFVIFMSSEKQPWNDFKPTDNIMKKKDMCKENC